MFRCEGFGETKLCLRETKIDRCANTRKSWLLTVTLIRPWGGATKEASPMFPSFKLIAVTAAISAGFVTAYDLSQVRAGTEARTKAYYDRVLPSDANGPAKVVFTVAAADQTGALQSDGKSDLLRVAAPDCASQTWPHIGRECLVAENGATLRKAARTITIEQRQGANASVLVRVPSTEIASR